MYHRNGSSLNKRHKIFNTCRHRKRAKKDFEKAPKELKEVKLCSYIQAQKNLRNELEKVEKDRVEQRINLIINEAGDGSDPLWKSHLHPFFGQTNEIP